MGWGCEFHIDFTVDFYAAKLELLIDLIVAKYSGVLFFSNVGKVGRIIYSSGSSFWIRGLGLLFDFPISEL